MDNNKIGALWEKGDYFTGNVEINGKKTNIVVFKNKKKQRETQPDYLIFVKKPKENNNEVKEVKTEKQNGKAGTFEYWTNV